MAEPTRTELAPHSIAKGKSSLIPMERVSNGFCIDNWSNNLFKNKNREAVKREMLIFITPKVLSDQRSVF